MAFYRRLILSLTLVSGIAAGLLAFTYHTTAPIIAQRDVADRVKAVESVFFLQSKPGGAFDLEAKSLADGVTALYSPGHPETPVYYAATGQAIGYNSSVPVTLMVGFTGPAEDAAKLLAGYVPEDKLPAAGKKGEYIVGFSVVNSEETPGLGEKIKDARPSYTWLQAATGTKPPVSPDNATDFQRQFRGRLASALVLKKAGGDLDAITAATMTSNGVVGAMRDASAKLAAAIGQKPQ